MSALAPIQNGSGCYNWPAAGKFVAQNERDSVNNDKKRSLADDDDTTRHIEWHFDTCVPTTMRLTVLALLIALPAAAYGAACPQQNPLEFEGNCAKLTESCADRGCCDSLKCKFVPLFGMVCPSLMGAPFSLIYVWVLSFM